MQDAKTLCIASITPHVYVYTRILQRDENHMQGNSNADTDFRPTTLTDLAALKAAFDKV